MKRYVVGMILALSALGAMAQETAADVKVDASAQVAPAVATAPTAQPGALPEGATTEQNPVKKRYLEASKTQPAVFRPNPSMPEITNEDLLRGMVDSGKAPSSMSKTIGYMPKLVVLPCAKGCEGKDYDRAVKEFIKGYRGNGKYFEERGEMLVQVRWFNVRPFLMRQLPYSADLFGVSFILEGKVVSLGKKSGVGISVSAHELARDMGARLGMELAYTLGVGARPTLLNPITDEAAGGFGNAIMAGGVKIDGALGVEDVRSRIEPYTDEYAKLLPAIDGIKPGEVAPVDKMRYLNSLMF